MMAAIMTQATTELFKYECSVSLEVENSLEGSPVFWNCTMIVEYRATEGFSLSIL